MNPEEHIHIIHSVVGGRCQHLLGMWEWDELVNMGYFGLHRACKGFREEEGVKFITYASICIYGSIIDEIRKTNWFSGDKRFERVKNPILREEIENPIRITNPNDNILELFEEAFQSVLSPRNAAIMVSYLNREDRRLIAKRHGISVDRIAQIFVIGVKLLKSARPANLMWVHYHREGV